MQSSPRVSFLHSSGQTSYGSRAVAEKMVEKGWGFWIDKKRVALLHAFAREWRGKLSGGTKVMQLVPPGRGLSRLQQKSIDLPQSETA